MKQNNNCKISKTFQKQLLIQTYANLFSMKQAIIKSNYWVFGNSPPKNSLNVFKENNSPHLANCFNFVKVSCYARSRSDPEGAPLRGSSLNGEKCFPWKHWCFSIFIINEKGRVIKLRFMRSFRNSLFRWGVFEMWKSLGEKQVLP